MKTMACLSLEQRGQLTTTRGMAKTNESKYCRSYYDHIRQPYHIEIFHFSQICFKTPLDERTTRLEFFSMSFQWRQHPLEVGTRGMINQRNRAVITNLCQDMGIKKASNVIKTCSKLALLGSYTLWNARFSNDWTSGGYLKP